MSFKKAIPDPSGTVDIAVHVRITAMTVDYENSRATIILKAWRSKAAFTAGKEPLWTKEHQYTATSSVAFTTRFGSAPANNLRNAIEADILALPEWSGAVDE